MFCFVCLMVFLFCFIVSYRQSPCTSTEALHSTNVMSGLEPPIMNRIHHQCLWFC